MFKSMKLGRLQHDPVLYSAMPNILDPSFVGATPGVGLIADRTDYKKRAQTGGMLGNDKVGNCTCAAIGHLWQAICANLGIPCSVTQAMVLGWYSAVTGYDPNDPSTDQGAQMADVLAYLKKIGIILAYGKVNYLNPADVATAINLFGGLYLGIGLPIAWQGSTSWGIGPNTNGIWKPWSWGGHAINVETYDEATNGDLDTWDSWVHLTADGRVTYADEAYAVVFPDWFDAKSKTTLQGFDLVSLVAALTQVAA